MDGCNRHTLVHFYIYIPRHNCSTLGLLRALSLLFRSMENDATLNFQFLFFFLIGTHSKCELLDSRIVDEYCFQIISFEGNTAEDSFDRINHTALAPTMPTRRARWAAHGICCPISAAFPSSSRCKGLCRHVGSMTVTHVCKWERGRSCRLVGLSW